MTTSKPGATRSILGRGGAASGVARAVVLGLMLSGGGPQVAAVEAGVTCSNASPGDGDYCSSSECGPCFEGEGDCDPGQCQAGLECVEEGSIDHCRAVDDSCDSADPGDSDYCSSGACGPCGDGEGDCDPGQCAAGFECVEEGSVDHCRPVVDTCTVAPNASNYCLLDMCGPCAEGEGDCEPGQCAMGLGCVEEGSVDRCRPVDPNVSNLEVKVDGVWQGVCCDGETLEVSDEGCWWSVIDRVMTDETAGLELYCSEGSPKDCECRSSGQRMHGFNGYNVLNSIGLRNGGPIYPDFEIETCVYVESDGELATQWTDSTCPYFRLK